MTAGLSTDTMIAEAMFSSAATVISHLLSTKVVASDVKASMTQTALRLDVGWVVTIAEIPSAPINFLVRFDSETLTSMVGSMMGGTDLSNVGSSMTGEIAAQIASTMAEALATQLGFDTNAISASVCDNAKALPAPPLFTFSSSVKVDTGLVVPMTIDFDQQAAVRLGMIDEPQAQQTVGRTAGGRGAPQAIQFSAMTPTERTIGNGSLDLVNDVPMQVRAILGNAQLPLRDIVGLQSGSVFELQRSSLEPIDLYVNNVLIARGEVVVVDEKFAVKISELNPGSHSNRSGSNPKR